MGSEQHGRPSQVHSTFNICIKSASIVWWSICSSSVEKHSCNTRQMTRMQNPKRGRKQVIGNRAIRSPCLAWQLSLSLPVSKGVDVKGSVSHSSSLLLCILAGLKYPSPEYLHGRFILRSWCPTLASAGEHCWCLGC